MMTLVRYDPMLTGLSSCGDPSSWVADVWNNRCEHQHQHQHQHQHHISISSISASASTTLFISRHLCPHYQRRERRRRNTTTTSSTLGILRLNINHSHFLEGRNITFTSMDQKYHFHFLNILFLKKILYLH